jgi:hypothetical protein
LNFRIILLIFISIAFSSCGVKSKPLNPPETAIKSYLESYTAPADTKVSNGKEKKK